MYRQFDSLKTRPVCIVGMLQPLLIFFCPKPRHLATGIRLGEAEFKAGGLGGKTIEYVYRHPCE